MVRLLFFLIGYNALAQQPPIPPASTNLGSYYITNVTWEAVQVPEIICYTNWTLRAVYTTNVTHSRPPALTRFKSSTNLFRVTCPSCGIERAMPAKRIEVVGYRSVPEGNIHERHIFFTCCSEEFKAKSEKLVITPIAIELKP